MLLFVYFSVVSLFLFSNFSLFIHSLSSIVNLKEEKTTNQKEKKKIARFSKVRRTRKNNFMYEKLNGMLILMWEMVFGSVSVERLLQAPKKSFIIFLKSTLEINFFCLKIYKRRPTTATCHRFWFWSVVWRLCCTDTLQ